MTDNILAIYGVDAEVTEVVTSNSGRVLFAGNYWKARTLDAEDIIPGNLVKVIGRNNLMLVVTKDDVAPQSVAHSSKPALDTHPLSQGMGAFTFQNRERTDDLDIVPPPSTYEQTVSHEAQQLFNSKGANFLHNSESQATPEIVQALDKLSSQIDAAFNRMDQKQERIDAMRQEIKQLLDQVDMEIVRCHEDKREQSPSKSLEARLVDIDAIVEEICGISF